MIKRFKDRKRRKERYNLLNQLYEACCYYKREVEHVVPDGTMKKIHHDYILELTEKIKELDCG